MIRPLSCTKCGGALVDTEDHGVQFGKCSSCGGMWFDYYALEALFTKQQPTRYTGRAEDFMSLPESSPSSLACPSCKAALMVITKSDITVEWCRSCKGIHLDADELEKIAAWRKRKLSTLRKDTVKAAASFTGGIGQLLAEEFGIRFWQD